MTEKQEKEFEKLRNIMVKSISTLETPSHMPQSVSTLFKKAVAVREGSMTKNLIDHFAKSIVEETIKE